MSRRRVEGAPLDAPARWPVLRVGVAAGVAVAVYGLAVRFRAGDGSVNLRILLVVLGAGSLGFQIADPWGVAYEYIDRTSSLNQNEAVPNPDGRFTYVVSAKDPGYANWLDPSGETAGILVLRWQVLPEGADPAKAIRKVEVVKLGALEQAMPAGVRKISPEERKQQQSERARQYARRLGQ